MPKTIIAEGKTTTEAISNGLKELNVSKDKVNIKILEEHEKRSFFSILAPRVVKIEMTLKEEDSNRKYKEKIVRIDENEYNLAKSRVDSFLNDFIKNFENLEYNTDIDLENGFLKIEINGDDSKILIGYRGDVLNSLQIILSSIANKNSKSKNYIKY